MVIQIRNYQRYGIRIETTDGSGHQIDALRNNPDRERTVCDLHVGASIKKPGDETRRPTPGKIILGPSDCLRIETRESFSVPDNVFGLVVSRASLSAEGLVVAIIKIDP